jgi:putative transposase
MRQSTFTETQIVSMLKEADAGRPVNEIWRTYGISSAPYYKWNATYGGLEASDIKRLKELEHENGRLKRMYADLSLENAALKDVLAKKLYGLLSGGRWCPHGQSGRPSDSAGLSGSRAQSDHVIPAGGQLGTARWPGH